MKKFEEDKPYPEERVGTRYKSLGSMYFCEGTILKLSYNDGTSCPLFVETIPSEGSRRRREFYVEWSSVIRIVNKNVIGGEIL